MNEGLIAGNGKCSLLNNAHTEFGAHQASYLMGTIRSVWGGGGLNGRGLKLITHHLLQKLSMLESISPLLRTSS
jgi:hypothetical protein